MVRRAADQMSSGNPTTSTSKGDVEIMKPTNDRCKYRRFVLSNQMECLLIFDPAAEKSAVSVNVHAGYFCEEKGREGIAQLLQNYIFFGSNFFDGFYSLLVQNNGSFQISTLPERSTYTYDVGNSTLLDSLARFPKFFIDPTFNYETVQGLANGNLRVINLGDNQVNISAIDQAQRNLTVDDHPYHQYRFDNWRLVIDKIEKQSLSITNELEIFYKSYYSSRRMRLVIYGRESLDRLQGAVQKEFSVISERESRPLKFPSDPCENCAQVFVEAGSVDGARSLRLQWVLRRSINSQAVDACSYLGYVFRLESKGSLSDKLKTLGWSSRYEVYESDCCSNFSFFTVHIYLTENGEGHVKEICGLVFNYIKMLKKEKAKRYIYNQLEENAKAYFNNGMVSTAMSHVDNISSNLLIHSPERCLIGSVVPSNYSVKAIELIMSELSPDRVRIFWVSSTFKREGVSSEAHVIPYSLKKITVLTIKDWMKLVDKEVLCLPEDPKPHTTKTVRKKATSKTVRKEASASLECVPSREKESDSPTIKEAHQTEEKVKSPVIKEVEHSAEKNIDSPAIEEAQEIVGKPYSVCIIYDERMMTHKSSSPHVENPQRIRAIRDTLKDDGVLQRCSVYKSERAKLTYVTDVHEDDYVIRIIKGKIKKHKSNKEMYFGEESESAIFFAAGGAIKVSHMVVTGKHDHGFAIIRPPGHHATAGVDSGFCYFNNVAVAAKILKREHNMKRILILDWDVHFGDGTSEIFYQDKNVLFISMHRFPNFFPHTKDALSERIGTGEGTGYNCNICWGEPMITDDDLFAVIGYVVMPLAEHFKPEIILVSAGFDAAKDDKLGDCAVSKFGYATVLHKLLELNTNIVLVLEGGYNLSVIGECSSSCVKVLLGEKSEVKDTAEYYPLGSTWNEVLKVRNLLKPHWPGAFATDIPEEVLARKRKSVVPLPGPKPPKA